MPLDWHRIEERYPPGTAVKSVQGTREMVVSGIDEEAILLSTRFWTKPLMREHLERAVELIESGRIEPRTATFVEQYGKAVTKERRSLAAHLLTDLGYLH
jgi:hypothetical protein